MVIAKTSTICMSALVRFPLCHEKQTSAVQNVQAPYNQPSANNQGTYVDNTPGLCIGWGTEERRANHPLRFTISKNTRERLIVSSSPAFPFFSSLFVFITSCIWSSCVCLDLQKTTRSYIYCHSKINVIQSNRIYSLKSFLVVTCGQFRCKWGLGLRGDLLVASCEL